MRRGAHFVHARLYVGSYKTRDKERGVWQEARANLPKVLAKHDFVLDSRAGRALFLFVKEVCRLYVAFRPASDPLHLNRQRYLVRAVTTSFADRPADTLPYQGDVSNAVTALMSPFQELFDMPKLRPEEGTEAWVGYMLRNMHLITFRELCQYRQLFKRYYGHLKRSESGGKPSLLQSDNLMWDDYVAAKKKNKQLHRVSPRSKTPQRYFPFLRGNPHAYLHVSSYNFACVLMQFCTCPHAILHVSSYLSLFFHAAVSHNYAINELRNRGCYPVKVSADDPDNLSRKIFSTYNKCLYLYWIYYCYAEGIHPSDGMARQVLLYLFFSTPKVNSKLTTCVHVLHNCLQAGTYRFPNPESLFETVLEILRENPEAVEWLTDRWTVS